MSGEVLIALAQFAGQTVVAAAITDVWESVRDRFARLIGRGDGHKTEVADRWLAQTHAELTAVAGAELEQAKHAQAERWAARFADLLDEDPALETGLRALSEEVDAELPAAADHSIAAGRDVKISADRGATAAGVIHGNVAPPGPTSPGPMEG